MSGSIQFRPIQQVINREIIRDVPVVRHANARCKWKTTMKYYRWFDEATADLNDQQWCIEFPVWCEIRWSMCEGRPVPDWDPTLLATYSPDGTPVDFPIVLSDWQVHSIKLKQLIERHWPGTIQYLPFRLEASLGRHSRCDYFVANHSRRIESLDRTLSAPRSGNWIPMNPVGDFDIERLVLSRPLIKNETIFRVLGDCGRAIVRKDVKDVIENNEITGCAFQEVEVAN